MNISRSCIKKSLLKLAEHSEEVAEFSLDMIERKPFATYAKYTIIIKNPIVDNVVSIIKYNKQESLKEVEGTLKEAERTLKELWNKQSDIIHNKIEIMSEMSDDPSGARKVAEKAVYETKKFFFEYLGIKEE